MATAATMRTLAPAPISSFAASEGKKRKVEVSGPRVIERPLRPLLAASSSSKITAALAQPARPILSAAVKDASASPTQGIVSPSPSSSTSSGTGSSGRENGNPAASLVRPSIAPAGVESSVQPKKEWVLPARAKPGRKPSDVEPPTKRKAQNRASQRAFRERRQSYLASLEAKVSEYEQKGASASQDIQRVARRLKEENESLKAHNAQLLDRVQHLEETVRRQEKERSGGSTTATVHHVQHLQEQDLALPLPDTEMDRDCGFCTEQSFCVCSGEAVLQFDPKVSPTKLETKAVDTVGVQVQPLRLKKDASGPHTSIVKPKLWQAHSAHAVPKSHNKDVVRPRSASIDANTMSESAFIPVGPSLSLQRLNRSPPAGKAVKSKLWRTTPSVNTATSLGSSASQQNAFICPTASHWQRRWAPTLPHRYSYRAPLHYLPALEQSGGAVLRPSLLSPPSLSAYSLSQYRTSRLTSNSRDEQQTGLHRAKPSIWPLNMLADVVTRTSDDDDERSAAESGSRSSVNSIASPTYKRRRVDRDSSDIDEPQACACPLSKIM